MAYKRISPQPVVEGGTGAQTLTGVVIGNGTSALTGNAVTQHDILVGGASNAITSVAPSATSGVPVISQGAAADPVFGTAVVAGGGTGVTTMTTAYAPVCAGTTATGNLQVASTGLATSGFVLTSNGSAALPSFQVVGASGAFSSTVTQVFTSTGTYTPTANMKYCIIEVVGGGGGGGGTPATTGAQFSVASGGGGGGYARKTFAAATIGVSQAVTIGAAGTAGTNAPTSGGNGGTTSVGALISATGGSGGAQGGAATVGGNNSLASGGSGSSGDFNTTGNPSGPAFAIVAALSGNSGAGGSSFFGGGAPAAFSQSSTAAGIAATSYGGGGSGAISVATNSAAAGGAGAAGLVVITEFI